MMKYYDFTCINLKCNTNDKYVSHLVEQELKSGDLIECPECKEKTLKRVLSKTPKHGSWTVNPV